MRFSAFLSCTYMVITLTKKTISMRFRSLAETLLCVIGLMISNDSQAADFMSIGAMDGKIVLFDRESRPAAVSGSGVVADFEYIEVAPSKFSSLGGRPYNSIRRRVAAACGTEAKAAIFWEALQLAKDGLLSNVEYLDFIKQSPGGQLPLQPVRPLTPLALAVEYACSSERNPDPSAKPFSNAAKVPPYAKKIACDFTFPRGVEPLQIIFAIDEKNSRVYISDYWITDSRITSDRIYTKESNDSEIIISRDTGRAIIILPKGADIKGECSLVTERKF